MAQDKPARWGQERRLEFIDFRLYWEGRVNRSDLIDFFGISVPQASLDLARYQALAPHNVVYDRTEKAYVATDSFYPEIAAGDSSTYLNQILGAEMGILQPNSTFLGSHPPAASVRDPGRHVDASVLRVVLKAIRSRRALQIEYQSMSRPESVTRAVCPHAIAFDGFRWHIRAFSPDHDAFRDFLFARILKVSIGQVSLVDPSTDLAWHREVEATIVPHPALTESQRRVIELDYGMQEGHLTMRTREALLLYLLKHLGLLLYEPENSAASNQIALANREQLAPFFASHGLRCD
jgi:predicted DNA-binding transcriptional regulator YafY